MRGDPQPGRPPRHMRIKPAEWVPLLGQTWQNYGVDEQLKWYAAQERQPWWPQARRTQHGMYTCSSRRQQATAELGSNTSLNRAHMPGETHARCGRMP